MRIKHRIGGVVLQDIGINVEESIGVLDTPEKKPYTRYSWRESDGFTPDLKDTSYKERVIKLKCWVKGTSWRGIKKSIDRLSLELSSSHLLPMTIEFVNNENAEPFSVVNNLDRRGYDDLGYILNNPRLYFHVFSEKGITLKKRLTEETTFAEFDIELIEPKPFKAVYLTYEQEVEIRCYKDEYLKVYWSGRTFNYQVFKDSVRHSYLRTYVGKPKEIIIYGSRATLRDELEVTKSTLIWIQ